MCLRLHRNDLCWCNSPVPCTRMNSVFAVTVLELRCSCASTIACRSSPRKWQHRSFHTTGLNQSICAFLWLPISKRSVFSVLLVSVNCQCIRSLLDNRYVGAQLFQTCFWSSVNDGVFLNAMKSVNTCKLCAMWYLGAWCMRKNFNSMDELEYKSKATQRDHFNKRIHALINK